MSYEKLKHLLESSNLPSQDRVWFARWVDRYRRYCRVPPDDPVPISRQLVIAFLQPQKARGRQAWQRLQMVKAFQFNQTSVCRREATDLDEIRETLRIATSTFPARAGSGRVAHYGTTQA